MRPAASSIASGRPSSRAHTRATAGAVVARSTEKRCPDVERRRGTSPSRRRASTSAGVALSGRLRSASGSTTRTCAQRASLSASRLVTSTVSRRTRADQLRRRAGRVEHDARSCRSPATAACSTDNGRGRHLRTLAGERRDRERAHDRRSDIVWAGHAAASSTQHTPSVKGGLTPRARPRARAWSCRHPRGP